MPKEEPLNLDSAKAFAERWYSAWNSADLDAIMACYAQGIEHSSPFIARFNAGTPSEGESSLRGKQAVREYFGRALERNPTPTGVTRFAPMHLAVGHHSIILVYRRMTGEVAGEVFFLNPQGLIERSVSHYG